MTKEWFRLEYRACNGWHSMYTSGGNDVITRTLNEAKAERTKAIKRHKPYGRDYTYRIVKITEEVVA
jgi:hypothetical protein